MIYATVSLASGISGPRRDSRASVIQDNNHSKGILKNKMPFILGLARATLVTDNGDAPARGRRAAPDSDRQLEISDHVVLLCMF